MIVLFLKSSNKSMVRLVTVCLMFQGGNDHEIYEDSRTIGHSVTDPTDTIKQVLAIIPGL